MTNQDKILAVESLLRGKSEEQICDEKGIAGIIFSEWIRQYWEIANQLKGLKDENDGLRKMFASLSLLNPDLTGRQGLAAEYMEEIKTGDILSQIDIIDAIAYFGITELLDTIGDEEIKFHLDDAGYNTAL